MKTCFDSSVLVAFYMSEPHSHAARKAVTAEPQAPFTVIHNLEVRNVFRLMVGWNRLTAAEAARVVSHLEADVTAGRLREAPLDFNATFARAEELSARYTTGCLSRSLGILHVAAALELSCTRFVTLDARQVRLAAACGLEAIDLSV